MKSPDVEKMTPEQRVDNKAACRGLDPGKYYTFNPPVEATAIPTGGPNAWAPRLMKFERGFYLGFKDESHVFQGEPIDCPDDIPHKLKESYFNVLFIGGVTAQLDENQG